jgi:hypothetical protein
MEDRTYGFEFPLPDKVRALQRELAVTVPPKYESVQETSAAGSNAQSDTENIQPALVSSNASNDRAEAVVVPEREAEPERQEVAALQRERPENPGLTPVESRQDSAQGNVRRTQNNPASDNRATNDQLPATASNWFAYVLGGVVLLVMGAG